MTDRRPKIDTVLLAVLAVAVTAALLVGLGMGVKLGQP